MRSEQGGDGMREHGRAAGCADATGRSFAAATPLIEIDRLSFSYEGAHRRALDDVSLVVNRGDFVGIIGESGAGKTTLGHCMNGIIPHYYKGDYYGAVRVDGADVFDLKITDIARVLGTVGQDIDGQMVAAFVEDELLYGLENFGIPAEEVEGRLAQALSDVGIADLRDREIATLSGGQKQKVALAALLALRPQAVLLDEPTAELDPRSSVQVFDLLRNLNQQGVTVVVIEQKVMLLAEYAQRLVVMDRGRIALSGSVDEAFSQVDRMVELGVNCPRVALLTSELNKRGIGAAPVARTVADAERYVEEVLA